MNGTGYRRRRVMSPGLVLTASAVLVTCASASQTRESGQPAAASPPVGLSAEAFWEHAKEVVYKSAGELAAQHAREIRKGVYYDKLIRGNPTERMVALTFDDGPHPEYTPKILAILKRYDVKATFFVVGEMALKYPDLVRSEVANGHVVGNHTFHHVSLTKIPAAGVLTEWQANQEAVKAITGDTMRFCRPPGGDYDDTVIRTAAELKLTTVLWTDDPGDYASPGTRAIQKRVLDWVGNGGIVLLHDGIQQTIDVLPQIIEHLRSKGYRFVTVAEMEAHTARR